MFWGLVEKLSLNDWFFWYEDVGDSAMARNRENAGCQIVLRYAAIAIIPQNRTWEGLVLVTTVVWNYLGHFFHLRPCPDCLFC